MSGTELGTLTMLKLPNDELVALRACNDPAHGPVEPSGISHLVIQADDVHATVAHLAGQRSLGGRACIARRVCTLLDRLGY